MSDPLYIFNSMSLLCIYLHVCVCLSSEFRRLCLIFCLFFGSVFDFCRVSIRDSNWISFSFKQSQIFNAHSANPILKVYTHSYTSLFVFFFSLYRFSICLVIKVSFLFYPSKQRYSVFISNVLVLWIYEESLWRHGTLEENLHTLVLISILCFTSTANMIYTF